MCLVQARGFSLTGAGPRRPAGPDGPWNRVSLHLLEDGPAADAALHRFQVRRCLPATDPPQWPRAKPFDTPQYRLQTRHVIPKPVLRLHRFPVLRRGGGEQGSATLTQVARGKLPGGCPARFSLPPAGGWSRRAHRHRPGRRPASAAPLRLPASIRPGARGSVRTASARRCPPRCGWRGRP